MNKRIHYTLCPVCDSPAITNVLQVKDHTVSGELFTIAECQSCTLRFTQDVPDENAIAPYYKSEDYISHTNTSKGFINRLYHSVRKRTIEKKRELVEKNTGLKEGKMLDVGSGIGSFVNEMKQHGWNAKGLEPDADARNVAKELYGLELTDIAQFYQLPADHFDAITLWHVLEHVHDLSNYVQQLKTLLKEKGRLFIAVPNYTATDANSYKEHWAAYDVPRHLYHFSPQSIAALMKKNGLSVLTYKPMWYDSFYISLLSSKYKNGKTNWLSAFWNGLRSNIVALANKKKCSSVIYIIGK
ncbi:MAG TPA: class I SAM-dependent methyltransferase [Chitinophagaceae bacterium]|nr:class I SAM-dependent methyltransferase [Chitinophagaceae bacterium]